jgi:hypothetical protein
MVATFFNKIYANFFIWAYFEWISPFWRAPDGAYEGVDREKIVVFGLQ